MITVIIKEIEYKEKNHLFIINCINKESNKELKLAVKVNDLAGININSKQAVEFANMLIGKEKKIQLEGSNFKEGNREKILEEFNQYPIEEIKNEIK